MSELMGVAVFGTAALIVLAAVYFLANKRKPGFVEKATGSSSVDSPSIAGLVSKYADLNGLRRAFVMGLIADESSFNPNEHNKAENAVGLMQIRPIAFEEFRRGTGGEGLTHGDLFDPESNIKVGTWYLRWIRGVILQKLGKAATELEILQAYKGGITRFIDGRVSEDARRLAERALRKADNYA